jgi:hypothetical protein
MTIDCLGVGGSILASGTNGVNVNDSATGTPGTIKVVLRGITIHGQGTTPGLRGINFSSGAALLMDQGFISGFNSSPGQGIFVSGPTTGGLFQQLTVTNTVIADNGIGLSGGGGIVLGNPGGAPPNPGVIRAGLDNVQLTRNNIGLRVSPNTESTMTNSVLTGNVSFNVVAFSGGGPAFINIDNAQISESIGGTGIHSEGGAAQIRVSRSTITGNNIGVAIANGGQALSAGNNTLQQNFGSNGAFSGGYALQ